MKFEHGAKKASIASVDPKPPTPLSGRSIWVSALVLLLVAVLIVVLLPLWFGGGSAASNARLEAIRIAGTIVLAVAGSTGLLLAARRQQSTEFAVTQKERELKLNEADATARRITDSYARAVEQLGSDKAPVRIAALYALELLAQSNQSQRQIVVNVLCAYLRMSERSSPQVDDQPVETSNDLEERQVRSTAQNILTAHLVPKETTFWSEIHLDLARATLFDFTLMNARVASCVFTQTTFHGFARFSGTTFAKNVNFDKATFTDNALLSGHFREGAEFRGTIFMKDAFFNKATTTGDYFLDFDGVTFNGKVVFDKKTSGVDANFRRAWLHAKEDHQLPSGWKPSEEQSEERRHGMEGPWLKVSENAQQQT